STTQSARLTGSIIPSVLEFALRVEPYPYDLAQAKRLLAAAGYPSGFDAGDLTPLPPFTTMGEAIANPNPKIIRPPAHVGCGHRGARSPGSARGEGCFGPRCGSAGRPG